MYAGLSRNKECIFLGGGCRGREPSSFRPLEPGITNVLNGISARMKYLNKTRSPLPPVVGDSTLPFHLATRILFALRFTPLSSFFLALLSRSPLAFFLFSVAGDNAHVKLTLPMRTDDSLTGFSCGVRLARRQDTARVAKLLLFRLVDVSPRSSLA